MNDKMIDAPTVKANVPLIEIIQDRRAPRSADCCNREQRETISQSLFASKTAILGNGGNLAIEAA